MLLLESVGNREVLSKFLDLLGFFTLSDFTGFFQGNHVQRVLQPKRQRLPLRLRLDYKPTRGVLHLRFLRRL